MTNIKHSYILITTQSNSAANLIVQRLIKFDQVNSSNLLRLLAFNYAQKSSGLPDDIKQYSSTVEDLIPGSKSITDRLISIMRFRIVVGTSTAIAQLLEAKTIRNHFTHAIIDEAGQSTELGILVPMSLVRTNGQTIMAGDPMQMPPLVINFHAITRGLNISTLSRLMECYSNIESLVRIDFLSKTSRIYESFFQVDLIQTNFSRSMKIKNLMYPDWFRSCSLTIAQYHQFWNSITLNSTNRNSFQ